MLLRRVEVPELTPHRKVLVTDEAAVAMLSLGRTVFWAVVRSHELQSSKVGTTWRVVVSSAHEHVRRQLAHAS